MCGFFGCASVSDKKKNSFDDSSIIHRGPDDYGEWTSKDGLVYLTHRRLSIVDLSYAGHQPMISKENSMSIVFNGEIYNHNELRCELSNMYCFKSDSDTEVILASYKKWGIDCVSYLEGMFSFAIYDSTINSIFLSRDRAGEKPLYYCFDDTGFYFASELKVLLSGLKNKKINKKSLDCYLGMGYVPSDRCIINNCKKLPSGNYLLFDISKNTLDVSRYWSIPDYNKCSKNFHENDLACELEVLLEKSIKKQLMADVPVGVLLSGGVDSSLITAIASRSVKNLKTFTVRFSDFHSHDETKYARLIAKKFNTDHHEIDVSNIDPEILNSLARQFDEPIVDSSMIPTFLVSKLVKRHCKVVLGGDGADELFGGYEHYSRLLLMDSYTKFVPSPLLSLVSNFSEGFIPVGTKARNWLIGCNYKVGKDIPMIAKYFDKKNRRSLMSSAIDSWNTVAEDVYKSNSCLHGDIIQRATRTDFHNYLTEDILVKVDRASMLNSLEVRAPFLDKNIIEFAFGEVPSNLKATKHNKKIILKKIAEKILPVDFENTRKQGFSIPLNEWLKNGKFRDFFYSVLLDPNCIFDKKTINSLLKGQDKGRNNGERLFALVMFELWRKEYDVSI